MADSRNPRQARPLSRRLIAMFTERLPYKAAAIFLSLLLWVLAESRESGNEVVEVQLAVNLDSTVQIEQPLPPVTAAVIARLADVTRLRMRPPIVHPTEIRPLGPDSAVIELTPRDVEQQLPPDFERRVRVTDVQPRSIAVKLIPMDSRYVPVRPVIDVTHDDPAVIQARTASTEPESVLVYGPRAIVQQMASVPTVRRTMELRDSLGVVVPLDTASLGVQVRPAQVRVRLSTVRDTIP